MKEESIKDTLYDIAGYALIGLAMEEGKWGDSSEGIRDPEYRKRFYERLEGIFAPKLEAYGTRDLSRVQQVTQRMMEKIMRVENLSGGSHLLLVKQHGENEGIVMPKKVGDCGYDIIVNEDVELPTNGGFPVDVACHFSMKVPDTHFALIINRSSTARKMGLWVVPGIIDAGYVGPIFTCVYNMTKESVKVEKGMRLAQCILLPRHTPPIKVVDELPTTERGETGFGSTGIKS